MRLFSEGNTLIYCDMLNCPHIKKHKLYWGKEKAERGNKYINVCGRKYVHFYNDVRTFPSEQEIAKREVSITYCSELLPR